MKIEKLNAIEVRKDWQSEADTLTHWMPENLKPLNTASDLSLAAYRNAIKHFGIRLLFGFFLTGCQHIEPSGDRTLDAVNAALSTSNTVVQFLGIIVTIVTLFFGVASAIISWNAWRQLEDAKTIAQEAMQEVERRRATECLLDLFSHDELVRRSAAAQLTASPRAVLREALPRLKDFLEGESPVSSAFGPVLVLVAREDSDSVKELLRSKLVDSSKLDPSGKMFYALVGQLTNDLWLYFADELVSAANAERLVWLLHVKATDAALGDAFLKVIRSRVERDHGADPKVWSSLFQLGQQNKSVARITMDLRSLWPQSISVDQRANVYISAEASLDDWEALLRGDQSGASFVRFANSFPSASEQLRTWKKSGHLIPSTEGLKALARSGLSSLAEDLGLKSQSAQSAIDMKQIKHDLITKRGLSRSGEDQILDATGSALDVVMEVDTLFGPSEVRKVVKVDGHSIDVREIPSKI